MGKQTEKEKKDKIPPGKALRYNLLMLGKIWKMSPRFVISGLTSGIVEGISGSIATVFTYMLFNALDRPNVTFGRVALYLLLILGVNGVITGFYAWYKQYYWVTADKKLQFAMHSELFDHALQMDLACYDDPKFYNDYVWAMDESKKRAITVMQDASQMLTYLIQISTLITLMMQVSVAVGLILFGGCVINAALWMLGDKMYFKKNERTKPYDRKKSYINRVYHLSDYAKELRIGNAGEKLQADYSESISHIIRENISIGKKMYWVNTALDLINAATRFGPIVILLFMLFEGTAELGAFVASINVIWQLQWSMYDLAQKAVRMPDNAQYIAKYLKFLEYKPKIVGGELPVGPLEILELRNVTFTYQPVLEESEKKEEAPKRSLENVNLTIRKGEKVAIVGYNGAGKTTLTKLLMRLYDPSEGEILYNGRNLKEYDIPSLRSRIGTVFQDYKIFAATVGENVLSDTCGEADREAVTDALTKATFREKLDSLEQGLDTHLTKEFYDEGVNLSGGESQKVAIARIFARPYDLIIMDEPSSALDPAAEYELNHTILEYAKDKTVVFISHRLSTTRIADRILMFTDGKLIESGSHDELMAQKGKYAEMFLLQAEKYRAV